MWGTLIGLFFGGKSPLDALSDVYIKYKDSAVEHERIKADIAKKQIDAIIANAGNQADVIKAGMQFKVFWIPWAMIAVPFAGWLGWGFLDSAFNGDLPDVAALPPQLKEYADIVIANLFYSGGGVAAVQGAASLLARRPIVERR